MLALLPFWPIISCSDQFADEDFNKRASLANSDNSFRQCTFNAIVSKRGSDEENNGGAISSLGNTVDFASCLFSSNRAVNGGACYISANARFADCTFAGNAASNDGGAIFANYANISIENCVFIQNHAEYSAGALSLSACNVQISNCSFQMNKALLVSSVISANQSSLSVNLSEFYQNKGDFIRHGTSISLANSKMTIFDSNFGTQSKQGSPKFPIFSDHISYVSAKRSCFDASSDEVANGMMGPFVEDPNNKYSSACYFRNITAPEPFDSVQMIFEVSSSLFTRGFVATAASLIIVGAILMYFALSQESSPQKMWSRAI